MSLRDELRAAELPGAGAAEERAWAVVRAAHRERLPNRRRRRVVAPALAFAVAAAVVAAALSPPGHAVLGSVRRALAPATPHARSALVTLPAPGRLLVQAPSGTWIVNDDGSKRLLGPYREATWSPHGLYVAAVHGDQLVALAPNGEPRWTLTRVPAPRLPSWNAPDGYRIAYLSGSTLRVVAGDGTGDRLLARGVAPTRPAWRPGAEHVLAYARVDGTLVIAAADTGRVLWRKRWRTPPTQLAWSPDGRRLLALAATRVRVYDPSGHVVAADAPAHAVAAAFRPGTDSVVEIRRRGSQSQAIELETGRTLFVGLGRIDGLAWSPDGRWLLLGWRSADEWLFQRVEPARRTVLAFSAVSTAFEPSDTAPADFPSLAGWCCSG